VGFLAVLYTASFLLAVRMQREKTNPLAAMPVSRYPRLGFADLDALDKTIRDSSRRELRGLIEGLVFCALVTVMRQSGTKAVSEREQFYTDPSLPIALPPMAAPERGRQS
jgi:hypothetical protein